MNTPLTVPFGRSYWVDPGSLLAGCYPGNTDPEEAERRLQGLLDAGVRCMVNLMEEDELNHAGRPFIPYEEHLRQLAARMGVEMTCLRMSIPDMDIPTGEHMRAILDTIDLAVREGRPVYVHCWGGLGRTGTVVGCYLARHGVVTGEDVLTAIQILRRNELMAHLASPQTAAQCAMICSWKVGE